jgi:hypothetical protein
MVRRRQSVIAMEGNGSYMEGDDRLIFWFDSVLGIILQKEDGVRSDRLSNLKGKSREDPNLIVRRCL